MVVFFLKRIALWRRRLPNKQLNHNLGFILIFVPNQFVKNSDDLKNAISSTAHHKLFAFLSATFECSGTFTIPIDTVLRSLFNNIVIRISASKHYSMQASHNELSSSLLPRYHSMTSMVICLNLLGHKHYTTILLSNEPHN